MFQFTASGDFDSTDPTFSATVTAVISGSDASEGDGVTIYNEIGASGNTDQVGTAWLANDGHWHCFWQCAPT